VKIPGDATWSECTTSNVSGSSLFFEAARQLSVGDFVALQFMLQSEDRGFPLDTYDRTTSLLFDINYDLKNGTFGSGRDRHKIREKFCLDTRWAAKKKRQSNPNYLRGIDVVTDTEKLRVLLDLFSLSIYLKKTII
jgi:hypothetical protein